MEDNHIIDVKSNDDTWRCYVRELTLRDIQNVPTEDAKLLDWLEFYCYRFLKKENDGNWMDADILDCPVRIARLFIEKSALFLAESIKPQEIAPTTLASGDEETQA